MKYKITRRDFLNGMAISTGTTLLSPAELFAQNPAGAASTNYSSIYPPTRTGIRGNHAGSFEVAHSLAWNGVKPADHRQLDEHYDLVIVGAGVSGLAAARFYQKRIGSDAKILLLDNHDDFGGHAKRNEFHYDGKMLLGIGGSVNLDSPGYYSKIAKGLMDDLGIDLEAMEANMSDVALLSATAESLLALPGSEGHVKVRGNWIQLMLGIGDYETAVRALPLPVKEQDKLVELLGGDRDYLEDLSILEKSAYIESASYAEFLTERVGLAIDTISVFYPFPKLMAGPAASRVSVMEAFALGCPGIQGMGWLGDVAIQILEAALGGYQTLYFADGNASVARLLVHKLIPAVSPNTQGFDDIATSRFDYDALDLEQHPVRLRLNSTVVGVRETDDATVTVDYVQNGDAVSVTGDHCVLACYNGAIPHLCPQLPETQKEALRYGVKIPLVMTNVLVENGQAFAKLGVGQLNCPDDPYVVVTVPPATTTGGHQPPRGPNDPMLIYMLGVPTVDTTEGETSRDILLKARHKVYATNFDTYEQEIRDQLQGLLGEYGFKHETDIKAITVNRWPHGYSYEYLSLDDPKWEQGQAPHEIGRAQFGRISIANSDSEARAYLDAAIDAGWRAVAEQTTQQA
ncbi:MAG: Tat pathway signal protein [Gammaproteobacteria bacterium]|jgi:spermidine dehydrogenase|nr:Tat pathway signal protein [Gammaproteobacteria bacterium]|tara:strand:- start:3181 stop:5070 length:1890 start_codon:yes stop_codon:yes gene_type:complete